MELPRDRFIQDAIEFFAQHNIKIVRSKVSLEPFMETNEYTFPHYEDRNLHLRGYCVLGAFPMFSNSIQKDYSDMIEKHSLSPLVRNLFTGIDQIDDDGIRFKDSIFNLDELDDVEELNLHYINTLNDSQEKVLSAIDKKMRLSSKVRQEQGSLRRLQVSSHKRS